MEEEKENKYLKELEQLFNLNKKRHDEIEKLKQLNKSIRLLNKSLRSDLRTAESTINSLNKKVRYLNAVIENVREKEKIDETDNVEFALNLLDINDF
jgi:uncharacterized phage infection (PIP) family protein YhgE